MAPSSKNAKTNRGETTKNVILYNGAEVEVCPALFFGKTAGMRNYMVVQNKASKALLVDANGVPLPWKTAKIEKKSTVDSKGGK